MVFLLDILNSNSLIGFRQLGCYEIAPPTPRVRNALFQGMHGCNFLIVGDATGVVNSCTLELMLLGLRVGS